MRKPKRRGVKLSTFIPAGAFVAALVSGGYALDIWAHIVLRRPYDMWVSERTAHGGQYVVFSAVVAVGLSVISSFFGYWKAALVVALGSAASAGLYFWGMSLVEFAPDG